MFNIISKELNVNGNICDLLEKFFKFLNKFEKPYAGDFDSKHDDYRDIDQQGKTDYINKKISMLQFHKELSKIYSKKNLNGL